MFRYNGASTSVTAGNLIPLNDTLYQDRLGTLSANQVTVTTAGVYFIQGQAVNQGGAASVQLWINGGQGSKGVSSAGGENASSCAVLPLAANSTVALRAEVGLTLPTTGTSQQAETQLVIFRIL